jgi:hypothetical protein
LIVQNLPAPNYTEQEARARGALDHTLRLRVLLGADGTVSKVELPLINDAAEEFYRDAVSAARRIRFRPATADGVPVSLWAAVDYHCAGYYFAHQYIFQCDASIAQVEADWRVIHE